MIMATVIGLVSNTAKSVRIGCARGTGATRRTAFYAGLWQANVMLGRDIRTGAGAWRIMTAVGIVTGLLLNIDANYYANGVLKSCAVRVLDYCFHSRYNSSSLFYLCANWKETTKVMVSARVAPQKRMGESVVEAEVGRNFSLSNIYLPTPPLGAIYLFLLGEKANHA